MKKAFSLLLALMFVLAFSACAQIPASPTVPTDANQVTTPPTSGNTTPTTADTTPTVPKEAKLTDLYVFGDNSDVIDNVKPSGNETDAYGKTYYGAHISLTASYSYGYGARPAYTDFVADGKYMYLKGVYFCTTGNYDYPARFQVFADGELVYDSGIITKATKATEFEVCINNADIVRVMSSVEELGGTAHVYIFDAEVFN